jgi:hypothetical protein
MRPDKRIRIGNVVTGCLISALLVTAAVLFLHLELFIVFFWIALALSWIVAFVLVWIRWKLVIGPSRNAGVPGPSASLVVGGSRWLFVLIAACAVLFSAVAFRRREAREREVLIDSLNTRGSIDAMGTSGTRIFGDFEIRHIEFRRGTYTDEELARFKSLFPNARISYTSEPSNLIRVGGK